MKSLVCSLGIACGTLLVCPALAAQVPPAPATATSTQSSVTGSTTFRSRTGKMVTIRSYAGSKPARTRPAPAFTTLDADGNGSIDASEAAAYPPLANDFLHADSSHDKLVSQSEYAHWVGTGNQ